MTILLVVDNQQLTDEIIHTLDGYEVRVATTLVEGMTAIQCPFVKLAVVDLNLPDSKGLETLESIKGRVPIIVLTESLEIASECAKKGILDYVIKDIDVNNLLSRIKFNLERLQTRKMTRLRPEVFSQIQACLSH